MGLLTKEFIQRVKKATDLIDLVSEYTEITKAGPNLWTARCPHPDHEDSTPSFRICHNADGSWTWYCGGCHCGPKDTSAKKNRNYGSDCFAFVQWMSDHKKSKRKIGWRESVEILAKRAGIPMEEDKNDKSCELMYRMATVSSKKLISNEKAMGYLHERGIEDETIKKWKIGLKERQESGHHVSRIVFPLLAKYNRVVGESARAIEWGKESPFPKYRNSANSDIFHKGSYLYGLHNYNSNFPEIRITEGTMDVVTADQFGVQNVVATLGTAFTKDHAVMLENIGASPCFVMDGDDAGMKGIEKAVNLLKEHGLYAKVCILPKGMDLADLSLKFKEKTEEWIQEHTMMYWEFVLLDALGAFENQLMQLRAKAMPAIMEASKGTTSPEDEILMKSFVKERFGIFL